MRSEKESKINTQEREYNPKYEGPNAWETFIYHIRKDGVGDILGDIYEGLEPHEMPEYGIYPDALFDAGTEVCAKKVQGWAKSYFECRFEDALKRKKDRVLGGVLCVSKKGFLEALMPLEDNDTCGALNVLNRRFFEEAMLIHGAVVAESQLASIAERAWDSLREELKSRLEYAQDVGEERN